jgi:hypothetical protein
MWFVVPPLKSCVSCTLNPKLLFRTTVAAANKSLFYVARAEFSHLEHADMLLATKDNLQRFIGVDPTITASASSG